MSTAALTHECRMSQTVLVAADLVCGATRSGLSAARVAFGCLANGYVSCSS